MNIILLIVAAINVHTIGLIVVLSIGGAFSLLMFNSSIRRKKKSNEANQDIEGIKRPGVVNIKFEAITDPGPGDYEFDLNDRNCVYSLKYPTLTMRLFRPGHNSKREQRDSLGLATSLAHGFDSNYKKLLLSSIPELTGADFDLSHLLIIHKSPAAKFSVLEDKIIKFVFTHLNVLYGWMFEEQYVKISGGSDDFDYCEFNLRVQTYLHLDLGRRLIALEGICKDEVKEDLPLCMDERGKYSFSLFKGEAFTWDELMPEIEQVFNEYFAGGVKFEYDDI